MRNREEKSGGEIGTPSREEKSGGEIGRRNREETFGEGKSLRNRGRINLEEKSGDTAGAMTIYLRALKTSKTPSSGTRCLGKNPACGGPAPISVGILIAGQARQDRRFDNDNFGILYYL